jgi:HK97 family phage portal protein
MTTMGIIQWTKGVINKPRSLSPEKKMAGFFAAEAGIYPGLQIEGEKLYKYQSWLQAFAQLPWLYAGAMALAVASVKPPLKIYEKYMEGGKEKRREVNGQAINKLIEKPNPFLSYRELIQVTVINLVITGDQFINLVPNAGGAGRPVSKTNPPVELMWMKCGSVQIFPSVKNYIDHYVYSAGGRDWSLDPSEVIHIKQVNPLSYWRGMGAMSAAENSSILELYAIAYNKNFLQNDAIPAGIISSPDKMSSSEIAQHRRLWNEMHKGPGRSGRLGYMWGGMKFEDVGTKPKDAQYIEMRKMNREEQLATLGVPPSIVGLLQYANYSNMEVQSRKFWDDSVCPILDLVADKFTLNLAPHFNPNYIFAFDYSGIKVLQEDDERKSRIAQAVILNGIKTPNQVIREMYKGEGYIGGNVYYMPMSATPVGTDETDPSGSAPAADGTTQGKARKVKRIKGPSFWATPERKEILLNAFIKRIAAKERRFTPMLETWLRDQGKAAADEARKASHPHELSAGKILDEAAECGKYKDKFEPFYVEFFKQAAKCGLKQTKGILWFPDEKSLIPETKDEEITFTDIHKQAIERMVLSAGSEILMTSKAKIQKIINAGIDEGKTVEQIARDIFTKLDELSPGRARVTAKTELCEVENYGLLEGYKENPDVEMKGWACAFVEHSRQGHMDADRKYSDEPIPLAEPFSIRTEKGEAQEMMFPGDANMGATPDNFCGCLCTMFPEVRSI